jgi:hypothetical protein
MDTEYGAAENGGLIAPDAGDDAGLTRRGILARSAIIGGAVIAAPALGGAVDTAVARPRRRVASGPPPAVQELQVEMVPLSHDDLSFTPSKWIHNGFTWKGDPLWFWWGYITGMPGQQNPILMIRSFGKGPSIGQVNHVEFQPGLFRAGIDLAKNAGSLFSAPAGETFGGALDPGGFHKLTSNTPGVLPNTADPDNLGGPNERTYEMSGTALNGRSMRYRAGTKAHRYVEKTAGGKLLADIRADYCPLTTAITPPAPFNIYWTGAAVARGVYRGQEVFYMSGFDRFLTSQTFLPVFANPLYQAFVFSGIHEDGTREWGASYFTGTSLTNYSSFGAYCRDGEAPIVSHDVKVDINYVSNANNPNQIQPKEAVYSWTDLDTGKSVHIHGRGTHSALLNGGAVGEVFVDWHENRSKPFARSMAAWEFNITPGSVPVSGSYTPQT